MTNEEVIGLLRLRAEHIAGDPDSEREYEALVYAISAVSRQNDDEQSQECTEINLYDREEIFENCTVQVWSNSYTGQVSVGWWPN